MTYFLRVADPKPLRKHILRAAKDVILVQYKAEELRQIREQKQSLKRDVQDLLVTVRERTGELRDLLGEKDISVEEQTETVDFEESKTRTQAKPSQQLDERDRLEYTLERIENALSSLD